MRSTGFNPRGPRGHVARAGRGAIFFKFFGVGGYGFCLRCGRARRVSIFKKYARGRRGGDRYARVRAGNEFLRGMMKDRENLSINIVILDMYVCFG